MSTSKTDIEERVLGCAMSCTNGELFLSHVCRTWNGPGTSDGVVVGREAFGYSVLTLSLPKAIGRLH